jgi:hypothetical protein
MGIRWLAVPASLARGMGTAFICLCAILQIGLRMISAARQGSVLLHLLFFRFAALTGILAVVCAITRKARPILPDERGKPVSWAPFLNEGQKGVVSLA